MPLTVTLPDDVYEYVEDDTADGQFGTADEYVTTILRAYFQWAKKRLVARLLLGLRSPAIEITEEEWKRLEQEIEDRIKFAEGP